MPLSAEEQFQANVAVMAARPNMQGMAEQLRQYPLCNIQLMPGPSGYLYGQAFDVATQQWVALADPHDPIAQAERDVEALYTRDCKVFTLLGMGLGYFATAFAKRLQPYQRLVVWDADSAMFKAMCYATDITPLFSDKRTDVFIGDQVITQIEPWWLKMDAIEKLHIAPPLRAGYTQVVGKVLYDALFEKTVEMMRFHAVGLSTWRMFGRHIGDNDLRNMPEYFANPGYEHLNGLWRGKPAVCLAAGPSLQKNLRHLFPAAIRNRIALISVGTIYALLRGLGLDPDVVTTIDFQRLNWTDQFQYIPLDPDCPLVYLHSTYPQTPRRWPGPRFVAENASDTVGWIRQYGEGKRSASMVQTVAHLNVMVALEMGCNPIILLGQDLSMPVTAHHTAGARAQDASPTEAGEGAFVQVPDYQGKPVHSRHSFLSMKTVFERLILEHPETTFINASEAGLLLQGAQHMPLQQALALVEATDQGQDSRTLRPLMKEIASAYVPQVKDTFPEEFAKLCRWVDELGTIAHEMLGWYRMADFTSTLVWDVCAKPDRFQAMLSSEMMSPEATAEDMRLERLKCMVALEAGIHERQAAFALFAIRRFDFLELMAVIPPPSESMDTSYKQHVYNAGRLATVARIILEELPELQRILREVARRLAYTGKNEPRQQYASMEKALFAQNIFLDDDIKDAMRYWGHYLYHTQQYDAALAVLDRDQRTTPAKLARIRRHLDQYRADARAAMAAYFPRDLVSELLPAVPDDTGMLAA